jgi:uncharacterized sulfatase
MEKPKFHFQPRGGTALKKPNILLITSDQQHWNTIGAFNPEIQTPNLDRLVREGTYFKRAYCPNPTCTPTRSSIITGMYPSQHGAWTLGTKLPESVHTVGEDFQQAGYKTALVGKAHFQPTKSTDEYTSIESTPKVHDFDFWREFHGPFYGFQRVELARNHTFESHVGQHYVLWLEEQGCHNWRDYYCEPTGKLPRRSRGRWNIPEQFHVDAWIAERTNELLTQYKEADESFFLWSSFFDPHPPYLVPEPWDTMYDPAKLTLPTIVEGEHEKNPPHFAETQKERPDFSSYKESGFGIHGLSSHVESEQDRRQNMATYYGMVSLMDKYIGRILDRLDELGLAEDTVVVFSTDHGHLFGQHGLKAKGPFHYEDLLNVPMIVRYPGKVAADQVSTAMQSLVDYAPTFLDLCELPIPRTMTGVSQAQVWLGEKKEARDHIICEFHHEGTTVNLKSYVDKRYKLTIYYNRTYGELFDLEADPGEVNNLWDDPSSAALKSELLLKYAWAELGKEPVWMPRISGA